EAVDRLRRAVAMEPTSSDFRNALGAAYELAGNLPEAEATYRQALQLNPDDQAALRNLADLFAKSERAADSVVLYERLLALNPADADVQQLRDEARIQSAGRSPGTIPAL